MLSVDPSGVLNIMMPTKTYQWRPVIVGLYLLKLFIRSCSLRFILCDCHRQIRFYYSDANIFTGAVMQII